MANLHIFVSVSYPKNNSVLIALYDFQRFGDLGRPIRARSNICKPPAQGEDHGGAISFTFDLTMRREAIWWDGRV